MTSLEFHCSFNADPGDRSRATSFFDDLMDRLSAHPGVLDAAIDADHARGEATISLTLDEAGGPTTVGRALLEEALAASPRGDLPIRLTA